MTWVAVPRLPGGTWVFASLDCGHIRAIRHGTEIPENWEVILCFTCGEYAQIRHTGVIRV